ncbi:hypothetical protein ACWEV3_36965 [Saccharopolyspora sp. NPDC003752]
MMVSTVCVACGQSGRVEAHHIAGRANHPTATVNVCPECHRLFLTVWQYAAGVPLDHQTPRTHADRFRAWVEGLFGLLALHAQRGQSPPGGVADAVVLSQRGFSRLLDLTEPSAAGLVPNGAIELHQADPASEVDRLASVAGLADLFTPLVSEVYDDSHPLSRIVSLVRGDPAALLHGIRRLLGDPYQTTRAVGLLDAAVQRGTSAARELLAVPDPTAATTEEFGPLVEAARALLAAHEQLAGLLAACLPDIGERAA